MSSTPQALHNFLHGAGHHRFLEIGLPELKPVLGPTWKRLDSDVNGEWGVYLFLDEFINDAEESKRAAAGWAGDRFVVYEGSKPGQVFLAQLTAWDTENDATEFFTAYAKRTGKRYPYATPLNDKATADRLEWQTTSGRVVLERRGDRVMILEGIPTNVDATALVRVAWPRN